MEKFKEVVLFVALVFCCVSAVLCDTPANCTYGDIKGTWIFEVGQNGNDRTINCTVMPAAVSSVKVTLVYPDVAVDEYGNKGFWTIIYNQGFEVVVHGRKYFAFSKYKTVGEKTISYCDQTMPGSTHDVLGHDWACYQGHKTEAKPPKGFFDNVQKQYTAFDRRNSKMLFHQEHNTINEINKSQRPWKATYYPQFEGLTVEEMTRKAGGRQTNFARPPVSAASEETRRVANALPAEWDWRNVDGVNYVSPVRNQGGCGSCYSFASLAMNEARLRILTNNTVKLVFSPQDIVECSTYSQGCDGGFPYLIGGKYAEDYGLVEESCNPYTGQDGKCLTQKNCKRHYSTGYRYVGGYYGACNEEEMKLAIVKNGPVAVGFEVYNDFMSYKSGVYVHDAKLSSRFNPFELTNHAVLAVGYGTDKQSGLNYWIVKNSWGTNWGEDGYFRILRGADECGIESMAVEARPVF